MTLLHSSEFPATGARFSPPAQSSPTIDCAALARMSLPELLYHALAGDDQPPVTSDFSAYLPV